MRTLKTVSKTDINKLAKEVLSKGPSGALPKNLPDKWLRAIGRDLMRAKKARMEGKEDDPSVHLEGPILLVIALLEKENGAEYFQNGWTVDDLWSELQDYAIAINDEIIGRETGVFLGQYRLAVSS